MHIFNCFKCFVENQNRINGFKLYGTEVNGNKLLIYSDEHPTQNRDEIFLDSTHMPHVPIKGITIENKIILTLCEVFVYGKIFFIVKLALKLVTINSI